MGFNVVNIFPVPGVEFGEDLLKGLDVKVVRNVSRTEDEIISFASEADAVIGSATHQPFNRRVIASLKKCRIIASLGVGLEKVDLDVASECGIVVTNTPDYGIDEVSGRAIAFMMALGHKLLILDRAVREKQIDGVTNREAYMKTAYPIFRMRDQTVGIIGLGRIGTAAALKAKGLGMRVIAYDPYVFGPVMESRGIKPVELDTLLKESDFISMHTPLNAETNNMIGYEHFKRMKPTCYFINTARGRCVDQIALVRALEEGLIAGAGIDVTVDEPMSPNNPLLNMGNVILTGHSAGFSVSSEPELYRNPMTQIVKALKGEWPPYAVNPEVQRRWLEKWAKKQ